ncbi:MAG: hypothetical protein COU06_00590, partial [Candidatus Harrisonbacteria bacterium CG10_big_fil_rev_8_21_14_0_10_38_8]
MKKSKKLKNLFLLTFGVILLIGLVGFIALFITINNLPSVELLQSRHINESTKIFDRTGEVLLFELYGEERRTVIPFDQIPEIVKQSTLVIEDVNFYNHGAVDIKGILRAALINAKTGSISQGGSTITQQFAKTAFLTLDRTFVRKFKEAILSYQLEKTFSKDEILGLYLNQIPYGSNAYGI